MKIRKYFTLYVVFLSVLLFLFVSQPAKAQQFKLQAVSDPQGTHVVLNWPAVSGVEYYNIYRKTDLAAPYPSAPLNSTPLKAYEDCAAIQAIIPEGSVDWDILAETFASRPDVFFTPDELFNPCDIHTIDSSEPEKFEVLKALARIRWKIAVVAGLGYDDTTVNDNITYYYRICSVAADHSVIETLDTDVEITAGTVPELPQPQNVQTWPGDEQVLVYWDELPLANGFNVYRFTSSSGDFEPINNIPTTFKTDSNPDGDPLVAPDHWFNGFLDYQHRHHETDAPISHEVNGNSIDGPKNGDTYYYKVTSVDILGNESIFSSPPVSATPRDKTPPQAPVDVTVVARDAISALEIRWTKVTMDIKNRPEVPDILGYRLFRYENAQDPSTGATAVGGLIPHPTNPGVLTVKFSDDDLSLRSEYGEKTYWYRVKAVDAENNYSAYSAAASGHLEDITPPASPKNVNAKGDEDYIHISWQLNTEPDIDGYSIYRSLCHLGEWNECPEKDEEKEAPCSGPFVLIGHLSHIDAEAMISSGSDTPYFEDRTVPADSPLCYAYLIKALDKSQNMSGEWPIPDIQTEEIVCQRLRDRTPPEPAFISKLLARDNRVLVEWIGPPTQDIKAYHVYRSESESGTLQWVGGMTVELPPQPGVVLTSPYRPPPGSDVGCNEIPLVTHEGMSAGSFLDNSVIPKQIYWYKVVGIDQNGNEADKDKAVPISTFTYSTDLPPAPSITSVSVNGSPCGLEVQWSPAFDSSSMKGFALFRSGSSIGAFHQLGSIVQLNSYLDTRVVKNKQYWYKVLLIDNEGKTSPLSEAKMGIITQ